MKPTTFKKGRLFLGLTILAGGLLFVSWNGKQAAGHYPSPVNDTVPKAKTDREKKVRNLDDALDEMDNVEMKLNTEKLEQQIDQALRQFDKIKIQEEVNQAMKEVDLEKMKKQLDESISKIDTREMERSLKEAMKQLDAEKIKQEVQLATEKVNWEKLQEQLNEARNIDMKKMEKEVEESREKMKELQPKLQKEMEKAKVEMEKAKEIMKDYKIVVDGLNADGLINKDEPYTIEHKNGELIVNGKKVSPEEYNKFKDILEKHKTFKIRKTADDFDIDNDKE